jgi:uncharacterized protein (DUF927 family)
MATTESGDRSRSLVRSLQTIPIDWALTPVNGNKIPYTVGWQKTPVPRDSISIEIDSGQAQGFGILTGKLSGGIMAIDCDGHIPHQRFKDILESNIPHTVSFTSGKDGRAQYLFTVPEEHWEGIKSKKIGKAKEEGQLEFRWDKCQSVLPPSVHPETGQYQWINSPDTTEIASLPDKVLDYLLKKPKQKTSPPDRTKPKLTKSSNEVLPPIPIERCLSKIHREALENGEHEGNRDNMGCSLARDLIGVAAHIPSISFEYRKKTYQLNVDGDPYRLLSEYCQKCTPPLSDRDCDRIYKSAQDFSPSPSIQNEESLTNCLRSWVKEKIDKPARFSSSIGDGLVKEGFDEDEFIGNHLAAIACVDNPDKDGAALLLEFKTFKGDIRRWTMLRAYLAGDGSAIAEGLLSRGYNFKRKQKGALLDYIQGLGADVEKTYTITDSSGWIGKSFVLPHKTYGDENLRFRDVDPSPDAITEIEGDLAEWKHHIGAKCAANSRMTFVVGLAFAAPLLPIVGMESGGIHLLGDTSQGKTTLLKVADSVVGGKFIQNWRSTANGLEAIATAHNHILFPIDELGQAEKAVGEAIYMLGNGRGKIRMTKQLTNRKPKTWQLLFLSSGEIGLGEYMTQAGVTQKGGQEVRMPSIPAVPNGSPFGVFETIHGCDSSKEFVQNLEAACDRYHGSALDAFLARLIIDRSDKDFEGKLTKRVAEVAKKLAEGTKDHAVSRIANRFALVQVALELAYSYDILTFPIENIEWSVKKIFTDWLKHRGGDGSIEIKQAIARIEHLLVTNELSDRVFTLPDNNNLKVRGGLLAYRKVTLDGQTEELWVPTSVFDKEFCNGISKTELVKELQRIGLLIPPRKDGKSIHQRWIKGKSNYYYVFPKRENSSEGSEGCECDSSNTSGDEGSVLLDNLHHLNSSREGSEGWASSKESDIDSNLHHLHHEKNASEGKHSSSTPCTVNTSALPSPPSPPSPSKTCLGISISHSDLTVGDRVQYVGNDKALQRQYAGILEVCEIKGDRYTCKKPSSSLTSWIELDDLQLVEVMS